MFVFSYLWKGLPEHSKHCDQQKQDDSLIRNKSSFVPLKTTDKYLILFLEAASHYNEQSDLSLEK